MCIPTFTAALFTIAKIQKQPKCPSTDEWKENVVYTHTHTEILAIKKEQNLAICDYLDGPQGNRAK